MILAAALALLCLLLVGCKGLAPQRGGHARHTSPTGARSEMAQPENPKDSATQKTQAATEEQRTLPPGASLKETKTTVADGQTNTVETVLNVPTNAPSAAVITSKLSDRAETKIGGSFADSTRDLAERVKSIRPVMFFGLAMLAVAGAFAYFGWWTKAAIAGAIGVGAIVLAQALPGNESKIILAALVAFALLALLVLYVYHKGKLDANGNGIPDALERIRLKR